MTPTTARVVPVGPGSRAPDFTAFDLDGNRVTLSAYLGRDVVLLDFYTTWCEPCVAELPHLRDIYRANKEKGFVLLAVSIDGPETIANVAGFARRNRLEFPMLLDEGDHISAFYNPTKAAPVTVLIDRAGFVVAVRQGYTRGDEELLAAEVEKAVRGFVKLGDRAAD